MSWEEYKNWVERYVLENSLSFSRPSRNEELQDEIKTKYELTEGKELAEIFCDIIESIDNENDENYYPFPPFQEGKSWQELFPNRLTTFFGRQRTPGGEEEYMHTYSTNTKPIISEENWDILTKIYDDEWLEWWKWEKTYYKAAELKYLLNNKRGINDELTEEMLFKSQTCQNFIRRAEIWLTDYQQLDTNKQEELKIKKDTIQNFLQILKNRQKAFNELLPPENPWPWTRIIRWGCCFFLGVLVALGMVWVINKIKSLTNK